MVIGSKPSALACAGLLSGTLLLAFATALVALVHMPVPISPRRLQGATGFPFVSAPSQTVQPVQPSQPFQPGVTPPTKPPQPSQLPPVQGGTFAPAVGGVTPTTTLSLGTTYPSSLDSSDSSSLSSYGSIFESSKSSESNSSNSSGLAGKKILGVWLAGGGNTILQVAFMLVFAYLYNTACVQRVLEARGTLKAMNIQDTDNDDFENGICECCSDKWVCIHGLCCPLVRQAHTNAVAGICGFWETALCWCCCALMSVNLGPCCLMVYWRMQLKRIMGISDHVLNDVCITIFCPCFSICQQGTAVDTKLGYQVIGCCELEWDKDLYPVD